MTGSVPSLALGIDGFAGRACSIQFTWQLAVKASFTRRLGYHISINGFLQFTFIGVGRGCSEMGPEVRDSAKPGRPDTGPDGHENLTLVYHRLLCNQGNYLCKYRND